MSDNKQDSVAVFPGSFDPVTIGHIDLIKRSVAVFNKVIVAVACNQEKTPLFTVSERIAMIEGVFCTTPQVKVETFDGLLIDYMKNNNVHVVIRGLRAVSDFEYEFQMALMNRKLDENLRTIFLMPNEKYTYLNSTIIRNLAVFHGDVADFVPPIVVKMLKEKNKVHEKNGVDKKQEIREDF